MQKEKEKEESTGQCSDLFKTFTQQLPQNIKKDDK